MGVNCYFDPIMTLGHLKRMKNGLKEAGLTPYLMTQPIGFFTSGTGRYGYAETPEYPFGKIP